MKKAGLKVLLVFMAILLSTVSFGYAVCIQCEIDPDSYDWVLGDPSTWHSQIDRLTIQCYDTCNGNAPVENYIAQYQATANHGPVGDYTVLTYITLWSTPTDSDGYAYLTTALLHEDFGDETVNHICPFDDVNHQCPGVPEPIKFVPNDEVIDIQSLACGGLLGCCNITITNKCNPPTSFSYCTAGTQAICLANNHDDTYMTVAAVWTPGYRCNYCSFLCEIGDAIQLSTFTVKPGNDKVTLIWNTDSEVNNAGFNIYRAQAKNGNYQKINSAIIPAKGSAAQGSVYEFVDSNVDNRATYYYKLEDLDTDGTSTFHGPKSATPRLIFGIK